MVDVGGATVAPGLIDPHTHPVLGDYTPRQGTSGWITSYLNGGVTTLISAGEPHWPGRPRTAAGVKAIAIAAHQSARNLRPGGAKLYGGALLLEAGLTAVDFDEMLAAGVWLLGEIGLGGVIEPEDVMPMVAWARDRGWIVPMHIGGASVPGSAVVGAELALAIQPDIACHTNGGPTARPLAEIVQILEGTSAAIEVVQAGNTRALVDIVRDAARARCDRPAADRHRHAVGDGRDPARDAAHDRLLLRARRARSRRRDLRGDGADGGALLARAGADRGRGAG